MLSKMMLSRLFDHWCCAMIIMLYQYVTSVFALFPAESFFPHISLLGTKPLHNPFAIFSDLVSHHHSHSLLLHPTIFTNQQNDESSLVYLPTNANHRLQHLIRLTRILLPESPGNHQPSRSRKTTRNRLATASADNQFHSRLYSRRVRCL